ALARQATTRKARERELETARRAYERGYRHAAGGASLDDAIYAGINAATVGFLVGRVRGARALARDVQRLCEERLASGPAYWAEASCAEAALGLGELASAEQWYERAARTGQGQYASLASTRRQAQELLRHRGDDPNRLDGCFGMPVVISFSGHMIDAPT